MSRMFKQLLSLTLAIMFLVCLMPVSASAAGYTAQLTFIDGWWAIQSYGAATTQINGGGTYTITLDLGDQTAQGTGQMSVLIPGAYSDLSSAGITVTSIKGGGEELLLDASKIAVTQVWADDGTGTWVGTEDLELKIYLNWESSTEGIIDITKVFTDSLEVTFVVGDYASSGDDDETTAPEDETTESTDASEETTEATEESTEATEGSSGTVLFSGSQTVDAAWTLGLNIDTTNNGGTFDPAEMANGGNFTVTYTGTEGALYMAMQDATNWGWFQVDAPASTVENADGSYTSTFAYADLSAKYGGAADFSDLGKVFVGTGNSTGTTVITELAWHAEAAEEEAPANAYLYYNDADWSVGTYDAGVPLAVTGPGTYTASWTPFDTAEGVVTFYISVEGGATLLKSCKLTDLKITADGVDVPVDMGKVLYYTNDDGSKTIEIYNAYNSYGTGSNPPIDVNAFTASEDITVTFTLEGAPSDGSNAATGDTFNFWLIPVMLVSAAALVVVIGKRKQFMA